MSQNIFVSTIDLHLADKLKKDLAAQGFIFAAVPYAFFSARKKGVCCTFYTSGKLVVQGAEMASFMEFYLEPEILKALPFTYGVNNSVTAFTLPYIGADESGKGDFFGPLCIATVYIDEKSFLWLNEQKVRDSKKLSALMIEKLAPKILEKVPHHVVTIGPLKYNELYAKFGNLNTLLAWGHATAIEELVSKTGCTKVLIDQFAHEKVMLSSLRKKNIDIELQQRHRAEEDIVVAAASLLARNAFVKGLELLEKRFDSPLPKGASSSVISAGKKFVAQHGPEALKHVAKLHFKTALALEM